uniref:Small nuclear ribonucleoprotein E n=33 Tax=Passeriformes TaxID=9126 RepID=A0A8C9UE38_SERCA
QQKIPKNNDKNVKTKGRPHTAAIPQCPARLSSLTPPLSRSAPRSPSCSAAIPQCPALLHPLTPPLSHSAPCSPSRSAAIPQCPALPSPHGAALVPPLSHSAQRPRAAMAYRGQGQKVQKVMVQPINLIFRYLQNRSRIQVWLYEQVNMRIEGCIIGFDEYMNLVLDDAEEIHSKTKSRKQLGRIMLKGDNITLLQSVSS